MYFFTLVVGYFAYAQYDVLFLLVIASDSVAIPVSKACGIYSVLYSDGLPRSLCSLAMTIKITVFASVAKQSPGRVVKSRHSVNVE